MAKPIKYPAKMSTKLKAIKAGRMVRESRDRHEERDKKRERDNARACEETLHELEASTVWSADELARFEQRAVERARMINMVNNGTSAQLAAFILAS